MYVTVSISKDLVSKLNLTVAAPYSSGSHTNGLGNSIQIYGVVHLMTQINGEQIFLPEVLVIGDNSSMLMLGHSFITRFRGILDYETITLTIWTWKSIKMIRKPGRHSEEDS